MRRLLLAVFLLCALLTPTASPAAPKCRDLDVLVNPTVTFLGEQVVRPDPELNPVTYRFIIRGFTPFDLQIRGIEPPSPDALLQHLALRLHDLGYVPAAPGEAPQVAVGVMWGNIFIPEREITSERRRHLNPAYIADRDRNKAKLLPAQTALEFISRPGLSMKWRPTFDAWVDLAAVFPDAPTAARDRIARICGGDAFVLSVGVFDWANLTKGREVLLWQTRAAAPARKLAATEALHRMLATAAPYFATAASYPSRIKAEKENAPRDLNLGFEPGTAPPAPVDLSTLIAHDFGGERPAEAAGIEE